ncbi:MarR family winged helix-turn-helix transcriptional regulator [Streptomyces asiaticus]|uniref:MarR family winged helix-turn-helix transcriptional regulator n=1 Tax=Streptomyces asiaticus TaxID=114695 RepID=UPI003F67110E
MDLRQVFDDLVRFETELWSSLDATLVKECGVTLGAFNALLIVSETPACRVNDLAAALSITVGGASQAVDRFEARGLLVRVPNPANRRSSLLELTAAGRTALASASDVFDNELSAWFSVPLGAAASARFAEDLATLRAAAARRRTDRPQSGE